MLLYVCFSLLIYVHGSVCSLRALAIDRGRSLSDICLWPVSNFLPVFPISFLYLSISLCQRFTDVPRRFFSGVRVPCDSVTGGVRCRLFQYLSYAPPFLFIISFSIGSQVVCSRSVVLVYPVWSVQVDSGQVFIDSLIVYHSASYVFCIIQFQN